MIAGTDIFNCNDVMFDNIFATNIHGDIEFNLESLGELGTVMLTKQQAAEFARQIIEMCGESEDDN